MKSTIEKYSSRKLVAWIVQPLLQLLKSSVMSSWSPCLSGNPFLHEFIIVTNLIKEIIS